MALSTVWRLIAHHENRAAAMRWSRQNNRIALGWDKLGDLSVPVYKSEEFLEIACRRRHPEAHNFKSGAFSLWNFCHEMQQGDLVILKGDKESWVVEVSSDYFFDNRNHSANNDYFHQREVKFTQLDPVKLWRASGGMMADGGSIYRALIRCAKAVEYPWSIQRLDFGVWSSQERNGLSFRRELRDKRNLVAIRT